MIPRVRARGRDAGAVLRYLFGPGDDGEHRGQRLVAAWAMATVGGVRDLEPDRLPGGGVSVARLAGLLEQPVVAGHRPPGRPVWHCSVHNHAADRELSDEQWAQIAGEFVNAVGLAPAGDLDAARWVAVRHDAGGAGGRVGGHVHIVATTVRQDGRTVSLSHDFHRCQETARRLESQLGLRRVGPGADDAEATGG